MSYVYISNPYNGTDEQKNARAQIAAEVCGKLLKAGVHAWSPIVHNHAMMKFNNFTLEERRSLILDFDFSLLKCAKKMIVLTIEGWEQSFGVQAEIDLCKKLSIPIVYLDPARVDQYNEFLKNGYVVIQNAFDPSVAPNMSEELERVHREFKNLKTEFPLLHKLGEWSIRSPQLASPVMRDFIFSENIAKLCSIFTRDNADLLWCATAAKPKESGKSFPWHQDAGYGGPEDYVTFWMAFDSVDEENGCLWAVPGSHREGILEHEFRKSDELNYGGPFIKGSYVRAEEALPVRLAPGDLVCMHSKLVHASFQNKSSRNRRGLITAFIDAGEGSLEKILGTAESTEAFIRNGVVYKSNVAIAERSSLGSK